MLSKIKEWFNIMKFFKCYFSELKKEATTHKFSLLKI